MMIGHRPLFGLLFFACAFPQATFAREYLEEIVVRGEFRDSSYLDTSGSVWVTSLADQEDAINHLEELLSRAANVNFSSGGGRARFVQIRGIGERGQFAEPLNPSVGLLLDGIDVSGIGTVATTYDVQQVEIFRGPQGTLYGANALAGLINVVSAAPTDEFYARADLQAGNFGARGVGAVVSGPVGDGLAYRISAQTYRDDGFIDNIHLRRDDTDNHDQSSVRAKLTYAGEQIDWQLLLGHVDVDNGYDAFSLDNDDRTRSDQPGMDAVEADFGGLSFGVDLQTVRFEGALGHADSDSDYGYDEDWTFVGFHPFEYASTDRYQRSRETTTLDLRLLSQGAEDELNWVVGAFLLRQEVSLDRTYTFFTDVFSSTFEIDRQAIYGELTQPIGESARLIVGLRAEQHEADYRDSEGVRFAPDDTMLGGRVVYEQDVAGETMLYAGVTRGYRAGGFNTDGTLPAPLRVYDPEYLWNVETGVKSRFLDGRARVAVSLFWMERRDMQVSTSRLVPRGNAFEFIALTSNASEGFNRGLEIEGRWQVSPRVSLFGSAGWLDSEYDDFINANGDVLDGREQAHAPNYQLYVGADIDLSDRWSVRLSGEVKDQFFFSDTHNTRSERYELLHASIDYTSEWLKASLWGRNITDEAYQVRGFFFGNDPRDLYTARSFTQLGEPARFGITLSVETP